MRQSSILVSVVIPAYNAAPYLQAALDSALGQTHSELEVIVVNDGSSDDTAAILAAAKRQDPRVVVLNQDRKGVAIARNRGIAQAKGEWVAPLDADDVWDRRKIEKQLAASAGKSSRLGLVYTWTRYIDGQGRGVGELSSPWEGDVFVPLVLCNFVGHASAPLIRRQVCEEVGGYDPRFFEQQAQGCEDWDLYLRLARRFEFAVVRELLADYRIVAQAMSRQHATMQKSYELMLAKLRRELPAVPRSLLRWSESQFCVYLAAIARANGDANFARRCWLRACLLNPLRLVQSGTYQRFIHRLPRWFRASAGQASVPGTDRQRRWDGQAPARLYDWWEERTLGRGGIWWRTSSQQS